MRLLDANTVKRETVRSVGLSPDAHEVDAAEVLAGLLRRCAGFRCPCPRSELTDAVRQALVGVGATAKDLADRLDELVTDLVGYGDLWEGRVEPQEAGGQLIYRGPLAFVATRTKVFLMGVAPDDNQVLLENPGLEVHLHRHTREVHLRAQSGPEGATELGDIRDELHRSGVWEMSEDVWLNTPRPQSSSDLLTRLDRLLTHADPSGAIDDLSILDSSRPVTHYKSRWAQPGRLSGKFIGRRPHGYGAAGWIYVELDDGAPQRFVEFPCLDTQCSARDEAWWAQAAIDAARGQPQLVTVRNLHNGGVILLFNGPVPSWAKRRWDIIASPALAPGALFASICRASQADAEIEYCAERLWLSVDDERNHLTEERLHV